MSTAIHSDVLFIPWSKSFKGEFSVLDRSFCEAKACEGSDIFQELWLHGPVRLGHISPVHQLIQFHHRIPATSAPSPCGLIMWALTNMWNFL